MSDPESGPWDDFKPPVQPPVKVNDYPWQDFGGNESSNSSKYSLSGLGKNVVQDVGRITSGLAGAVGDSAKTMYQVAAGPSPILDPVGFYNNATQTPVAQEMRKMPSNVVQGVSNFIEDPIGSMYRNPVTTALTAAGVASGGAAAYEKASSLFEVPETLKSAGINATTLEHMAPGSQAPGDYANAVESQLKNNNVLANSANETWKLMDAAKNDAGKAIGDILQKIKKASAKISDEFGGVLDPTVVDAQTALKPILEASDNSGTIYSEEKSFITPYQEAHDALMKTAQKQGGVLTLDNIDAALKRTGSMMDKGEEAVSKYGPVYGKLADVRDGMIETIAQNSNDPSLKSDLLKNNADYSTYSRVLPSIERAGYREAIKAGVSAYQKHVGPLGEKLAIAGGSYAAVKAIVDKILGSGH